MKIIDNFFNEEIKKTVFISEEQLHSTELVKLYGKYFPDTEIINVFPPQLNERGDYLCNVNPEKTEVPEKGLFAVLDGDQISFYYDGERIKTESYGLYQSIFSRNKGILETGKMGEKRVVILGLRISW